jgi:Gas vesicle synthesis protein GvpL/GvpF
MAADGRCVWVYGVAADSQAATVDGVAGVGGGRVRLLPAAGLTAIVGDVGQREFGAVALRSNLEDLDWLAQTARAHHAVIAAVASQHPVVPLRLATVYESDQTVAEMLRQRSADLREALDRVAARSEWGVKAYIAEGAAASGHQPAGREGRAGRATGPGAAYLRQRRAQLTARKSARDEAMASVQAIHAELGPLSVAARLHPPQPPELTGERAPMLLNAAYLVADERADRFTATVTDLADRHPAVRLTLTGPWPAYSFVGDSAAGEPRAAKTGQAS